MAYRALTEVLLGTAPPAKPGDILPEHYLDMAGNPVPIDLEHLVQVGAAEKVDSEPKRRQPKAKDA